MKTKNKQSKRWVGNNGNQKCKMSEDQLPPLGFDNPLADDHQKKKRIGDVFKETTTNYPSIERLWTEFPARFMTTIRTIATTMEERNDLKTETAKYCKQKQC